MGSLEKKNSGKKLHEIRNILTKSLSKNKQSLCLFRLNKWAYVHVCKSLVFFAERKTHDYIRM